MQRVDNYKFYKAIMGFKLDTGFYVKHIIAGDLVTNSEYKYLTNLQKCMVWPYGTARVGDNTLFEELEPLTVMSKRKRNKAQKKVIHKQNVLTGLASSFTKKESIERALNALFTKTGKQIENPKLEYTPKDGVPVVDDVDDSADAMQRYYERYYSY